MTRERIPGKFITIIGNDSDNRLKLGERTFWILDESHNFDLQVVHTV